VALAHGLAVITISATAVATALLITVRSAGRRMLPFVASLLVLNAFDAMVFVGAPEVAAWLVAAYGRMVGSPGRPPDDPLTTQRRASTEVHAG
jgi:hypothetical protein